jgi:hypothetical protein
LSAGKSFLCSSKETVRPQKHLLVIRRKYKKRTKVNKESPLLKAKKLGSYEEGKTVTTNGFTFFHNNLAHNLAEVAECHTDLEVVDLDSM